MKLLILLCCFALPFQSIALYKNKIAAPFIDSTEYYQQKGKTDAILYYHGNKPLNIFTAVISFVDFAGLIPALITQFNHHIKEKNLHYPDKELWQNSIYKEAYIKQALKIRRKKVWIAFGIGAAILLAIIFIVLLIILSGWQLGPR